MTAFRTHPMLRSPHLQTLWGPLLRRHRPLARREQQLALPDGDHLWLVWAGPEPAPGQTRVLILHGLSGSAESHYARGMQAELAARGIPSVVMNARGTGQRPNNLARGYHAGEIDDLTAVMQHLHRADPAAAIPVIGYSIGGSRLLNWLAEHAPSCVPAAIAVSVPLELAPCATRLEQGFSKLYRRNLIDELLRQVRAKHTHLAQSAPDQAAQLAALGPLEGIRTFRDFDNRIVAPLHGFRDAEDYYARASAGPKLCRITTPTLLIQALDDPFMPAGMAPGPADVSSAVALDLQRYGGHVGFVSGSARQPRYWLEERIPAFLQSCHVPGFG